MTSLDSLTDVTVVYHATCNKDTDFGAHISGKSGEVKLPADIFGMYLCTKLSASNKSRCDQASIIYNMYSPYLSKYPSPYRSTTWTDAQTNNARRKLLCHESGHGLGLYHNTGVGGCMQQGIFTTSLPLSQHHVDHINKIY